MFRDVPECSGMFHVPDFIDHRQNLTRHLFGSALSSRRVNSPPRHFNLSSRRVNSLTHRLVSRHAILNTEKTLGQKQRTRTASFFEQYKCWSAG